ncbi:hypothetical protein NVV95_06820 [Herbiconiux sp. CPCC 205716]|uniref:DUF3800 domain-containing protein n=1 Tax=Herbiconiux gentiana TaxID=2970912 RepID=A0ABT2GDG3_9MICO|nr:hypothetical protein [Herbiconiux gentiana]MCS5714265.1 hypothetical protein [Herbiconiux gentiana]
MPAPILHAWIDESMRTVGVPRPSYLLGGLLADPGRCDPYRAALARLRTSGVKLHWRELDARHRRRALDAVAHFDAEILIVIASPMDHRKQERARSVCLERLAWELQRRGVSLAHLEARTTSLMLKDDRTVDRLRRRGLITPSLRFEHRQPHSEPMLWAADLVLGLIAATLAGEEQAGDAMRRLADVASVVHVDL